jgi:alcohol dehydrogenase
MQAAVYDEFGGPIRVVSDYPLPRIPLDGIRVQVRATGVCRSDWHGWQGHDGDIKRHGLPFVPGHEFSGVVHGVGSKCYKFRVGDRVAVPFILSCGACRYCIPDPETSVTGTTNADNNTLLRGHATVCQRQEQPGFTYPGSFAEYVAVPRADRNVRHLPSHISFVQAAALGCRFTTAYRAVYQQSGVFCHPTTTRPPRPLRRNQSIVIIGCGGVGLSCVMLAASALTGEGQAVFSTIVAVDVSENALSKALDVGATHIVKASTPSDGNPDPHDDIVASAVRATTPHGDGCNIAIDAIGMATATALHCLAPTGRCVQVGLPGGGVWTLLPVHCTVGREWELVGSHGFDAAHDWDALLSLVANASGIRVDPARLVERCVTLAEGVQCLMDMSHGSPLGMTMITKLSNAPADARAISRL